MGGHLPPAGTGIVRRTHTLQQHFIRSHAQRETKRAIAIIGVKPIVSRFHGEGCGHTDGLVTGARNLEIDFLLTFKQDFPVVHTPRAVHQAIGFD